MTADEERLQWLSLGDLDNVFSPLTPLSAIPAVAGIPFLSAPPQWSGAFGVLAAAGCGLFREPEFGEPPQLDAKEEQHLLRWLMFGGDETGKTPPDDVLKWLLSPGNVGNPGTAFQRTTYGLSQISAGYQPRDHFTFVIGDTAADFAAAHAHQVMYGNAWWLPAELSPCGDDERAARMRDLLHSGVINRAAFRNGRITVTSATASPESLDETLQALRVPAFKLGGNAGTDQRQLLGAAVVTGDLEFPSDGAMSYAVSADLDHPAAIPATTEPDGTITMLSPVPVPDVTDAGLRDSPALSWQVEVRPEGAGMPAGRGLQGAHLVATDPLLTWTRSGRWGPRFESERYNFVAAGTPRLSRLARPKLRILALREWMGRLAGQQQHSVRASDAGRRAEVLAAQLGGRENLTATFAGLLLPVLKGFLSTAARTGDRYPNGEGVVLHAAGTNDAGYEGYLTFDGIHSFGGHADLSMTAEDVDVLTRGELLTRGIIVNCDLCGRVAFTSLDRAGSSIICLRCGSDNALVSARWRYPPAGPAWYFDLHPVARDLLRDHGEVPLQLAHHLRSQARLYTDAAELEICNAAGSPVVEIDLPAYADGQVIVAEAKSSPTLGSKPAKEVRKKVMAADMVQADQLAFATTQPAWDPASLAAIRTTVAGHSWASGRRPAVRIITSLGSEACQDQRMQLTDGALTAW